MIYIDDGHSIGVPTSCHAQSNAYYNECGKRNAPDLVSFVDMINVQITSDILSMSTCYGYRHHIGLLESALKALIV